MKDSTVPSRYAMHLLEQASLAGCDINVLLEKIDLQQNYFDSKEDIPATIYGQLYQLVMRATQDEWFGMFVGGRVPLGAFRLMGLTLVQCSHLEEAVIRAGEFAEICRGMRIRIDLDREGELPILKYAPLRFMKEEDFNILVSEAKPEQILTSLYAWHRFAEWLVGKELNVKNISVSCSEGDVGEPLAYITDNINIEYEQPYNGLTYFEEYLELPVVQDHESLMLFLSRAPYNLVTKDPQHIRFYEKVRNILKKDVAGNMPTTEQVASQLNISVTTLRRRLQEDNTSFQKLKDECRMEAAFHYLGCLELSSTVIAEKLGFDEPSAFFRSFKKWTGQTPGEYRTQLVNHKAEAQ